MRYRREFKGLIIIVVAVTLVLVIVAYMPRFWDAGDNTPLEHEMSGEPPPEFRQE